MVLSMEASTGIAPNCQVDVRYVASETIATQVLNSIPQIKDTFHIPWEEELAL